MFPTEVKFNLKERGPGDWALTVMGGKHKVPWALITWEEKPEQEEVRSYVKIFLRSVEIYISFIDFTQPETPNLENYTYEEK